MKIPKSLKSYVKVYNNFFDDDFCKKVVGDISDSQWEEHEYYHARSGKFVSYDKELSVSYTLTDNTKTLQDKIWDGINKYITEDFKFPWFSGWSGYSEVRYNKYNVNTQMRLHCDHIHTIFDGTRRGIPTLSVLGLLNNDFEGGEFVMWENDVLDIKAGSLIIFPSNFMYPHEVKPVIRGTRYSFVSWVW